MGTLYIDRKNLGVKLDGNALAFYSNGERQGMAPINPLSRVVVVGTVIIETPVLHRLADEGISVLFLSGRHARFRGSLHGKLHNNGLLRVKQYEKLLAGFGATWGIELVRRKIEGQMRVLKDAIASRPDLRFDLTKAAATLTGIIESLDDSNSITMDSVRGFEGSAAAHYFSAYTKLFPPSLRFTGRNRRPPRDPANALLSLSYTMLHYELLREIEVIGLDPTIGFYHEFEYGRQSLACDLVEIFRPDADRFAWRAFADRVFTNRDFASDGSAQGCYLKKTGRQRFYELYEAWASTMRGAFTGCVRELARRILNGQDPVPD